MELMIRSPRPIITDDEIKLINQLISDNPNWGRTRLSKELCNIWNWRYHDGRINDNSCRTLLLRLDKKGIIKLPARLHEGRHLSGSANSIQIVLHDTTPVISPLADLRPLRFVIADNKTLSQEFASLVEQYHYLGYETPKGENIKYLVYSKDGILLSCLVFSCSAWACASRDKFLGWDAATRKANLRYISNNSRYLVLPWVRVPHLASHILGLIAKRVSSDWEYKYGHKLHLLETFVERDRFRGSSYKAANWILTGETTGRSRNDRYSTLSVPIKDVYLYPLHKNFRKELCNGIIT